MDSCRGQGAMWLRNQLELKLGAHGLLERRVEPRAPGLPMAGTLPSLSPHLYFSSQLESRRVFPAGCEAP